MSRRTMLALSAALTAFALVMIGAVAAQALRTSAAPSAKTADTVPVEVVRARELEYRRLVDEANARLRAEPVLAATSAAEPTAQPADRNDEGRPHERHERARTRDREDDEDDDG